MPHAQALRTRRHRRRRTNAHNLPVGEPLERRRLFAVITAFTPRFSANEAGDITLIANTLMTAPDSNANAANARAGIGSVLNDNDFSMVYVDVDSDAATFNSSRATLDLPGGSAVLGAFLYWGGRTTAANRNEVRFATPASGGYVDLTGTVLGSNASGDYEGFADVTALVQTGGEGVYATANVQATTGSDRYAGWTMVVAYRDPASLPRNLTVFDGFATVDSTTPNVSLTVSGFTTPPTGSVNAKVGVVAYDGDRGLTGDSMTFAGTTLTNGQNPSTNFFNSSISLSGSPFTAKDPNYLNQLGFDADIVTADGVLANSATSATINLTTGGEFYSPGVVTTAIELFAPVFTTTETVIDANSATLLAGEELEYTVVVTNTGGDSSGVTSLAAPISANTTFVPGSLEIVSGDNSGSKTDATGDDQANFDAGGNQIVFRLGAGADATTGGALAEGESATVRFRVTVNGGTPHNTVIAHQSTLSFTGATLGGSFTGLSNEVQSVVSPENDPPVNTVPGAAQTVAEDTPLTFTAAGGNGLSVADVDAGVDAGGTGNVQVTLTVTNGTVTLGQTTGLAFSAGDGTADGTMAFTGSIADVNSALEGLSFAPTANFNGAASIQVLTNDLGNTGSGGAKSDTDSVAITVTAVNDPPVANDESHTTAEDTPLTVNAPGVLGNDTDVDGDTLTAAAVTQPTNGTLTLNANGSFTYTPAAGFNGADSFTYRVDDGSGTGNVATVLITVNAVNDPPNAVDDGYTTAEDTPLAVTGPGVLDNDSDPEGDAPLTVSEVSGPSHGALMLNADGSFTYTPASNYNGPDSFTYAARDPGGATDEATVNLTVSSVNDAPVAVDDSATTNEDTPVAVNVPANDSDVDANLDLTTVTLTTPPANGSVSIDPVTGVITYTPDANFNGADTFTYGIRDASGAGDSATVGITVTAVADPPAANDDVTTTPEDAAVVVDVADNDFDPDGDLDPTTVAVTAGPANGLVSVNPLTGAVTYTPAADFTGPDTFTYRVSDAAGNSDTATVSITVGSLNDPPTANDDAATVAEDSSVSIDVVANDTDPDGAGDIDRSAVTVIGGPSHGTISIDPTTGAVTYSPRAHFNGVDTFLYQIRDAAGATSSATATITVAPAGDAPAANDDAATTAEDTPVIIDVTANDADPDGTGQLVFSSVAITDAPDHGSVSVDPITGDVTYTPAADFNGADTFAYSITDTTGATDAAQVTVIVEPVNDPPVPQTDTAAAPGNRPVVVDVLANDDDPDGRPDLVPGTVQVVAGPANGTVSVDAASGAVTYTPNPGFTGEDSFTYEVYDTAGARRVGTVNVSITPVAAIADAVVTHRGRNSKLSVALADLAGARTVRIDWGDGRSDVITLRDGQDLVKAKHRYLGRSVTNRGRVRLTVLDADGMVLAEGQAVTPNEQWVTDAFLRILGRNPDERELAELSDRLDKCRSLKRTREEIAREVLRTPEARARRVNEIYGFLLGRTPTPAEIKAGVALLADSGSGDDQLVASLAGSDEYFAGPGGGTGAGFAVALSNDVLGGRAPTAEEVAAAEAAAAGDAAARTELVRAVTASAEYRTRAVNQLSILYRDREATRGESRTFVKALQKGRGREYVIARMLSF